MDKMQKFKEIVEFTKPKLQGMRFECVIHPSAASCRVGLVRGKTRFARKVVRRKTILNASNLYELADGVCRLLCLRFKYVLRYKMNKAK